MQIKAFVVYTTKNIMLICINENEAKIQFDMFISVFQ